MGLRRRARRQRGRGVRMPVSMSLTLALVVLAAIGFTAGRARAFSAADAVGGRLHSLPNFHGWFVAIWSVGPALVLLAAYGLLGDRIADKMLLAGLDADTLALPHERLRLFVQDVRQVAFGGVPSQITEAHQIAARDLRGIDARFKWSVAAAVIAVTLAGFSWAHSRISPLFRSRNHVERVVRTILFLCSAIAVLTTLGIVLSLVFESLRFFQEVSPLEFLFGLHWSPQTDRKSVV